MRRLLFQLCLAVPCLALSGQSLSAPTESAWRRVVVREGAVVMSVPCPESGNRAARHPELVFTCVHNGLQFSLAIGAGPTQKGFEDNLAAAQRDNGEIETEITALGSRRAFTSFSHPDRPVVRVLVVDYTPNEMILAIVAEQPEGGISPSDRPAAMELAKRFIATLEVPAK